MNWIELERAFTRAVLLSFSRKKMILTFPSLIFCGVLIVFCRAVAFDANNWIAMSLTFLPILLSSGVLFALGVLLIQAHDRETKRLSFSLRDLIFNSADSIISTSFLSIPSVLAYLCFWILMGVFYLFKEIPLIGDFFSVVFSFCPFLLIFSSLCLCLANLTLLFFAAPLLAFQPAKGIRLTQQFLQTMTNRLLTRLILLAMALIPIGFAAALLSFAAVLTRGSFLIGEKSVSVALEWFFIMLPFAALLTPAVIFFFNFAAESHRLLDPSKCWGSMPPRTSGTSGTFSSAPHPEKR
jgi:hypothetical protein